MNSTGSTHFYEIYCDCVIEMLGRISKEIRDTQSIFLGIRKLLESSTTLEMLGEDAVPLEMRQRFLQNVLDILMARDSEATKNEDAIQTGLTASSLLGDQDAYIYYTKKRIRFCFDNHRPKEAKDLLAEWKSILPDDPDWNNIRGTIIPKKVIIFGVTYAEACVKRFRQMKDGPEIIGICDPENNNPELFTPTRNGVSKDNEWYASQNSRE